MGLTLKNPAQISGIKGTEVYSRNVSDEKQGLVKMKGHDRKLSPACIVPLCLHPLEQTRFDFPGPWYICDFREGIK